jgi:hypothetical protein
LRQRGLADSDTQSPLLQRGLENNCHAQHRLQDPYFFLPAPAVAFGLVVAFGSDVRRNIHSVLPFWFDPEF